MVLNFDRAIKLNNYWSHRLGWDKQDQYARILRLFHSHPRTPREFAEAVAQWQYLRRPRLVVDGIVGPKTWGIMRTDLGITSAPFSGPHIGPYEPPPRDVDIDPGIIIVRGVQIEVEGMDEQTNGRSATVSSKFHTQRAHIEDALNRLPPSHLAAVPKIIVGDRPFSGGGFYRPPLIRLNRHTFGAAWNKEFLFTLIHEIGHAVDNHLRIVSVFINRTNRTGAEWAAYRAIEYKGRNRFPAGHAEAGTPRYGEHFAEGYAHMLTRPHKLTPSQRTLIKRLARM